MSADVANLDSFLPSFGWKISFGHKFAEKRNQNIVPRVNQVPQFVGLGLRYLPWYIGLMMKKKKPVMDGLKTLGLKQIYGVPLGGIGGGTIGRGFKGEFCRFQLFPGQYEHHVVKADNFIICVRKNGTTVYQQVLSPRKPKRTLSSWNWGFPAENAVYLGLYPRSWTVYRIEAVKLVLICRQISPVIPNDYKDSALPVGVFVWEVINESDEDLEVSIALTFQNGIGSSKDTKGGHFNEPFSHSENGVKVKGVMMYQRVRKTACSISISALEKDDVTVSHLTDFNPRSKGLELWTDLLDDGAFDGSDERSRVTLKGEVIGAAVCARTNVVARQRTQVELCVSWDMPKFAFPAKPDVFFYRRYTRWFGSEGKSNPMISHYALTNFAEWEGRISNWQQEILENESYPDWYKSAIFNELYYVSDGGSVWIERPPAKDSEKTYVGDVRSDYGKFAYLEGHEYRMFNTYDVHFYASFALIKLWPKLQLSIQYDMADFIISEDNESIRYLMGGDVGRRKTVNSVPHDIGDPEEGPWQSINGYNIHDTANWRDLNLKFVLQVYRDYMFTNDESYLRNMWPVVKILMEKCLTWDKDGDGVIENSGKADQTYDTWIMTGMSAYCGGLWLASLFVTARMSAVLGLDEETKKYEDILTTARKSYNDTLWTGKYYKFDGSSKSWSNSIMADQLCGHWYLRTCGHKYEVFPEENVKTALKTLYDNNVMRFKNGRMGAVNSMKPDGRLDTCTIQAEEMWIGVAYALASLFLYEGMSNEAMVTAKGVYSSVYDEFGMAYQTPEALHPEKHYRSLGYMRPLSIFAIQCAFDDKR